jgi:hypothetical protein
MRTLDKHKKLYKEEMVKKRLESVDALSGRFLLSRASDVLGRHLLSRGKEGVPAFDCSWCCGGSVVAGKRHAWQRDNETHM